MGERWFLRGQVVLKVLDVLRVAFEKDFYACVTAVMHISCQAIGYGDAVDKGAETDPLDDTGDLEFDAQEWSLRRYQKRGFLLYISKTPLELLAF